MKKVLPQIKQPDSKHPITPKDLQNCEVVYTGELCIVGVIIKNEVEYAVKMIKKQLIAEQMDEEVKRIQNQINCLYRCQHPNIIELLGHFETQDQIVLVFPNFGSTLDQFIKGMKKKSDKRPFNIDNFIHIFHQIASAVFQLQVKGFIHRDLSADNILINQEYQIKLIDFGYSSINNRLRKTKIGTLMYLAPEIMEGKPYNHKVDVWALGIICYQLIYGVYLFRPKVKGLSQEQIQRQYIKNMMKPIEEYSNDKLLINQEPPEEMLADIKCMLSYNPQKRPQVGYMLSRQIFGATRRDTETYDLKQYIRKRTQRKPLKAEIGGENSKQMSIRELQQTLASVICQHSLELRKNKQLISHLINAYERQQNVRIQKKQSRIT